MKTIHVTILMMICFFTLYLVTYDDPRAIGFPNFAHPFVVGYWFARFIDCLARGD